MLGEKWLMVAVKERFYILFEAINTNRFRLILAARLREKAHFLLFSMQGASLPSLDAQERAMAWLPDPLFLHRYNRERAILLK
jgi:hypothetical protein